MLVASEAPWYQRVLSGLVLSVPFGSSVPQSVLALNNRSVFLAS